MTDAHFDAKRRARPRPEVAGSQPNGRPISQGSRESRTAVSSSALTSPSNPAAYPPVRVHDKYPGLAGEVPFLGGIDQNKPSSGSGSPQIPGLNVDEVD